MNHLSPSEFVDFVEGTLDAERGSHAERCESCRRSGEELRRVFEASAARGDMPEPSPLFWEHFSARVREAVAQETVSAPGWMAWRPAFVAIAALAIFVTAGSLIMRPAPVALPSATGVADVTGSEPVFEIAPDANTEAWEVLTAAAADLEWDEAREAGMGVQSAVLDRAVQRLSADELTELGRLLQSELKRASN
jgi:hypothetical protein